MTIELPSDLDSFLRDGQQFEYNVDRSEIGPIKLKDAASLYLSTISVYPNCQTITEDPFTGLHGVYRVEVCDLVADSEWYEPTGLFCWLPLFQQFGTVDREHGHIVRFQDVRWTDIVNNPLPYLDAKWDDHEAAVDVLPWCHFPFHLDDVAFSPYPDLCPIHGTAVCEMEGSHRYRSLRAYWYRIKRTDEWIQEYQSHFPCAGTPVTDSSVRCCVDCRTAEEAWIEVVHNEILKIPVSPDSDGYINCPGCLRGVLLSDPDKFTDGVHTACGQRILIVN